MNIQVDNYYISVNKHGIISICVDGQMIIHNRTRYTKREDIISDAVRLINEYNKRHNLSWGRAYPIKTR